MDHDESRSFETAKVLLVDDDRRLLSSLNFRLCQMVGRCTCCTNSGEAMMQFMSGHFDLVITDLTMPGIDGLTIVGMIRSQSNVPIIILTGHCDDYYTSIVGYRNVT